MRRTWSIDSICYMKFKMYADQFVFFISFIEILPEINYPTVYRSMLKAECGSKLNCTISKEISGDDDFTGN